MIRSCTATCRPGHIFRFSGTRRKLLDWPNTTACSRNDVKTVADYWEHLQLFPPPKWPILCRVGR